MKILCWDMSWKTSGVFVRDCGHLDQNETVVACIFNKAPCPAKNHGQGTHQQMTNPWGQEKALQVRRLILFPQPVRLGSQRTGLIPIANKTDLDWGRSVRLGQDVLFCRLCSRDNSHCFFSGRKTKLCLRMNMFLSLLGNETESEFFWQKEQAGVACRMMLDETGENGELGPCVVSQLFLHVIFVLGFHENISGSKDQEWKSSFLGAHACVICFLFKGKMHIQLHILSNIPKIQLQIWRWKWTCTFFSLLQKRRYF